MATYSDYGTGIEAQYIELIDRMLREKRDYISTVDVLKRFQEEYNPKISLKASKNKTFDHAKGRIRKCLQAQGLDFDEQMIDGKFKEFKYPENVPEDLLSPLRKKTRKLRQKTLTDLIQKSQGLFPASWLAKFQLQAEEEINGSSTSPIIAFDSNEQLWNLDLLPTFYHAIRDKQVLKFTYAPYAKPERTFIFHPHYLKEYNSRWFVFGLAIEGEGKQYPSNNCALDRIVSEIEKVEKVKYIPSSVDYSTYFDDIVGVTRLKGYQKEIIEIEAKDLYTYMRILTKRLHKNQKVLQTWNEQSKTGRFSIEVIPNPELLGLLMSFEGHVEILGNYRTKYIEEVNNMYNLYKK